MSAGDGKTYEETLEALNSLIKINVAAPSHKRGPQNQDALAIMRHYIDCLGLDLSSLSVVHVAGTKGKGSTSAFTERLLRAHGYKTALFTSPHLIDVRERFRLNGDPVSKDIFVRHFWRVYTTLLQSRTEEFPEMPGFFRFLTLMGFDMFVGTKVDVAVLEVGLGGRLDPTNVCVPTVTGVTLLDLDHTSVLGPTITSIAGEKAGIFKTGVPAFTVPQPEDGLQVLLDRANTVGTTLQLACPIAQYDWGLPPGQLPRLGLDGSYQYSNAALALALTRSYIDRRESTLAAHAQARASGDYDPRIPAQKAPPSFQPTITRAENIPHSTPFATLHDVDKWGAALESTVWPGRAQVVMHPQHKQIQFFIDGAHTGQSIDACAQWFVGKSQALMTSSSEPSPRRVLLFNCSAERDHRDLLQRLLRTIPGISLAVFCPPSQTTALVAPPTGGGSTCTTVHQEMLAASLRELLIQAKITPTTHNPNTPQVHTRHASSVSSCEVGVYASVQDAMRRIEEFAAPDGDSRHGVDTLVTGSLYLVGGALNYLQQQGANVYTHATY